MLTSRPFDDTLSVCGPTYTPSVRKSQSEDTLFLFAYSLPYKTTRKKRKRKCASSASTHKEMDLLPRHEIPVSLRTSPSFSKANRHISLYWVRPEIKRKSHKNKQGTCHTEFRLFIFSYKARATGRYVCRWLSPFQDTFSLSFK